MRRGPRSSAARVGRLDRVLEDVGSTGPEPRPKRLVLFLRARLRRRADDVRRSSRARSSRVRGGRAAAGEGAAGVRGEAGAGIGEVYAALDAVLKGWADKSAARYKTGGGSLQFRSSAARRFDGVLRRAGADAPGGRIPRQRRARRRDRDHLGESRSARRCRRGGPGARERPATAPAGGLRCRPGRRRATPADVRVGGLYPARGGGRPTCPNLPVTGQGPCHPFSPLCVTGFQPACLAAASTSANDTFRSSSRVMMVGRRDTRPASSAARAVPCLLATFGRVW